MRRRLAELTAPENKKLSINTLIEKGLSKFSIVTIQLEPDKNKWENPQEIFESMNSLGKPLSLADLIRNYLLLGLSAEEQDKLYHNYWLIIEKTLPDQVSNFIRDYMQCKDARPYPKATDNNHKALYAFFKDLFKNKKSEELLKDLVEYASIYACIALYDVSTGNDNIDRLLNDIRTIGASTTYCFIMEILEYWKCKKINDNDVIEILRVLNIYIMRRRLAELTAPENKKKKFFEIISIQETSMRMPNFRKTLAAAIVAAAMPAGAMNAFPAATGSAATGTTGMCIAGANPTPLATWF